MADTKISALTAVTTPAGTDEFAVNQGGTSKKVTLAQIMGGAAVQYTSAGSAQGAAIADYFTSTLSLDASSTPFSSGIAFRNASKWFFSASTLAILTSPFELPRDANLAGARLIVT